MKAITGLLLVLLAPVLLVLAPLAGRTTHRCPPSAADTATTVSIDGPEASRLDAGQRANAAIIIDAAVNRGLGRAGAVIGVMTALTESSLRNLGYGDAAGPDSRGLFQQRSSWGPRGVRMSPTGSSGLFFNALEVVPGWRSMQPWRAAQAVQHSAFADGSNYRSNYTTAIRLVTQALSPAGGQTTHADAGTAALTAAPATSTNCTGGTANVAARVQLPAPPRPYRGGSTGCVLADPTGTGGCVTGATAHLLDQTKAAFGRWPWGVSCWDEHAWSPGSDHPLGRACDFTVGQLGAYPTQQQARMGWALAQWYRTYAERLHVDYVIWDGRIWSTDHADEGWRRYDGGGIYSTDSPTGSHSDHVHISAAI